MEYQAAIKMMIEGTSLVVQWLTICLPMQQIMGSIPGRGTKTPRALGQLSPVHCNRDPMMQPNDDA